MKKMWISSAVLILILGIGFYSVYYTSLFNIKEVRLNAEAHYVKAAYFEDLIGQSIVLLPKKSVAKRIQENPYVLTYGIQKRFPGTLFITVKEREEFAAITFKELFIVVDSEGMVLDIRDIADNLLILEGFTFESVHIGEPLNSKNKESLASAIKLMILLKENAQFSYKVYYKSGIRIELAGNLKANFGEGESIKEQFIAFMTLYEDILRKGIETGVIDVSKKDYYIFKPSGD